MIAMKKICGPILFPSEYSTGEKVINNNRSTVCKMGKKFLIFYKNIDLKGIKNAIINNSLKMKNNNINNNNLVVDSLNIKSFLCARQTEFMIEGGNHKNPEEIKEKLKCINDYFIFSFITFINFEYIKNLVDEIRNNLYLEMKYIDKFPNCKKFETNRMKIVSQTRLKVYADYKRFPNKILNEIEKKNKMKIIKSIISIILLLVLVCFILYVLTYLISIAFQINKFRFIKTWLIPSLISLLLVSVIVNFIMNFVRAIFLFKLEGSENKTIRFLSENIITEESRYMYNIRNFLTKYYKKLDLHS